MQIIKDFSGCKIILRNLDTGETLLETIVLECDANTLNISIAAPAAEFNGCSRFSALLFSGSVLYEFQAKLRQGSASDTAQFSLHHGTQVEHRTAKRFPLRGPVFVRREQDVEELAVIALNISTSGALLEGPAGALALWQVYHLRICVAEENTFLTVRVIRANNISSGVAHYGCSFLSLESPQSE